MGGWVLGLLVSEQSFAVAVSNKSLRAVDIVISLVISVSIAVALVVARLQGAGQTRSGRRPELCSSCATQEPETGKGKVSFRAGFSTPQHLSSCKLAALWQP